MLVDLKQRIEDEGTLRLLSYCVFDPTEVRLSAVADSYKSGTEYFLWGFEEENEVVGLVGLDVNNPERIIVKHIAVDSSKRNLGIGRQMLLQLVAEYPLADFEAETDDDAVGFYRSCGFDVIGIGEKYPGVMRYLCILSKV